MSLSEIKIVPGILLLTFFICGWLLFPESINGDGIGYLKQIQDGGLSPGHILYVPFHRLLANTLFYSVLFDLVLPFRFLNLMVATCTLGIFYLMMRHFETAPDALFTTSILGLSEAFFQAATDLETYSWAMFCEVLCIYCTLRYMLVCRKEQTSPSYQTVLWAFLMSASLACAILFHLTLILIAPVFIWFIYRFGKIGNRIILLLSSVFVFLILVFVALILAFKHQDCASTFECIKWLKSADHGIPYQHSILTPLYTIWGFLRSFVYIPYPYEADWWIISGLTVIALLICFLFIKHLFAAPTKIKLPDMIDVWMKQLIFGLALPLIGFAVYFFPSDTERWIFILPIILLKIRPSNSQPARAALLLLLCINLLGGHFPAAINTNEKNQAQLAANHLRTGDMVVSPGHGWEELLPLFTKAKVTYFPFVYYVGSLKGTDPAQRLLHQEIEKTFNHGGHVYVIRSQLSHDSRGYKELEWMGMTYRGFFGLFKRYLRQTTSIPDCIRLEPVLNPKACVDRKRYMK